MDAGILVEKMKLSEQAERYEDMAKSAKELCLMNQKLTDEQRNLLSVSYKNVVGARRSAWRIISQLEQRSIDKGDDVARVSEATAARKEVENELEQRCGQILDLLNDHLLKTLDESENKTEAEVFYRKMEGDYYRYLVEVTTGDKRDELVEKSKEAYEKASEVANDLSNTHPIKLGLALNFSTFYYEIQNDGGKACEMAKKAFDDAIADLDDLKEESYKDSTLIMQLLRDNLTLWTSENDDDENNQ